MNQQLLDLYTDSLISSFTQTTATRLSRLLEGAITHDVVTNFLCESDFSAQDLWRLVRVDVRRASSDDAAVVIDTRSLRSPTRTKTRSSAGILTTARDAASRESTW